MNVKTAFLNRELKREIYMEQPMGSIVLDHKKKVCKQVKSLHGMNHAPNQYHEKFDTIMLSIGL